MFIYFFLNLGVRLIYGCGLYTELYGSLAIFTTQRFPLSVTMFVLVESLGRVKQLWGEGEVEVLCPNLFSSHVMINNYNLPGNRRFH